MHLLQYNSYFRTKTQITLIGQNVYNPGIKCDVSNTCSYINAGLYFTLSKLNKLALKSKQWINSLILRYISMFGNMK